MPIEAILRESVILDGQEANIVKAHSFGYYDHCVYFKNKSGNKFLWINKDLLHSIESESNLSYNKEQEERENENMD